MWRPWIDLRLTVYLIEMKVTHNQKNTMNKKPQHSLWKRILEAKPDQSQWVRLSKTNASQEPIQPNHYVQWLDAGICPSPWFSKQIVYPTFVLLPFTVSMVSSAASESRCGFQRSSEKDSRMWPLKIEVPLSAFVDRTIQKRPDHSDSRSKSLGTGVK